VEGRGYAAVGMRERDIRSSRRGTMSRRHEGGGGVQRTQTFWVSLLENGDGGEAADAEHPV
jgi:hypothetical protein